MSAHTAHLLRMVGVFAIAGGIYGLFLWAIVRVGDLAERRTVRRVS